MIIIFNKMYAIVMADSYGGDPYESMFLNELRKNDIIFQNL